MKKARDDGHQTPMWTEGLTHMGDIAWELFEAGIRGEKLRNKAKINCTEIIEQFKELYPKVRDSQYARRGAGDRAYGLRACIAIFRTFLDDHEVLDSMLECLPPILSSHKHV